MKSSDKKPVKRRILLTCLFHLFFITSILLQPPRVTADQNKSPARELKGPVYTLRLDSSINPGSGDLLDRALREARIGNASCLLILLDTPGGLVATLRKMVQAVMQSEVPVIVYVYPPGARAASAGAILTLAADVAAMAPGTNIGAAHPVSLGRKMDSNSTMGRKIENDLAAMAISLAAKRKRNVKWAEQAVRKSISVPADTALKLHVIDIIARDPAELLKKVQGRQVETAGGRLVRIYPDQSRIIPVKQNLREKVLGVIADPNIAYVLMMIGMVGLYFELAHPGAIFPGTAGAISLILAFYALQTLPASTTGVILVLLAFLLFVLELFITSHGILAISGVISLVLGSMMLFDTGATGISIAASVLWPTLISVSMFLCTIAFLAAKATLSKPRTGTEGLRGEKGVVKEVLPGSRYMVFIHGELWHAVSPAPLRKDQVVAVESMEGLTLKVKPLED